MPFLDFIKNRNAQPQPAVAQQTANQQPQNAQAMYRQEAAREKATLTPLDKLSSPEQAKVDEIKQKLEKSTSHRGPDGPPPGGGASPEAMRQKMTGQDRNAPALSPTGAHMGQTAAEKVQANSPEPQKRAQQTIARRPPSWER